ncbi:GreA/GreB family elongation factor [Candidatus Saccharibacteria bacterium]|nr:GreA/GreB family elongation factor [Candidatus Saccharibacteria bacterium]
MQRTITNQVYLTKPGLSKLQTELKNLTSSRWPDIVRALRDAASAESTFDNREYDDLRIEQALVEKRITELRGLLNRAHLVNPTDNDRVSLGNRVKLRFLSSGAVATYNLVDTHEADPLKRKISDHSPIGRALLGKKINDEATVDTGSQRLRVRVLRISA